MIGYAQLRVQPLDDQERLDLLTALAGGTFSGEIPGEFVMPDLSRVRVTACSDGCRIDRAVGGKSITDSFFYRLGAHRATFIRAESTADLPVTRSDGSSPSRSELLEENDGDELICGMDPARHIERK